MKEDNTCSERDREIDNRPIARHIFEEHQGKKVKFGVQVIGKPSRRIIGEAVYIDALIISDSLNEKNGLVIYSIKSVE